MLKFPYDLIAIAFLGSERGSRAGFGDLPKPSGPHSSRVGLKVRDRET